MIKGFEIILQINAYCFENKIKIIVKIDINTTSNCSYKGIQIWYILWTLCQFD